MNYLLRNVVEDDLDGIFELSKLMVFINLPADKDTLKKKIKNSIKSFKDPSNDLSENSYIFTLIDISKNKIIGVSMIHGKHGSKDEPHFYLKVGQEQKYSTSLNTGFVHGTLKFGMEHDGWSEIGGLILHPDYRGDKNKLGKLLSYTRFLYIAFNQKKFTDYIHCELMPPFDSDGNSPLWEAIGRKFLNLDYNEADMLSRKNKEFIMSLYPQDTIYGTLLPAQARDSIGKVGEETQPVKRMLEKIGFKYMHEVDPFDGGPHYRALTKDITLVKNRIDSKVKFTNDNKELDKDVLLSLKNEKFDFSAVKAKIKVTKDAIIIDKSFAERFQIIENSNVQGIYLN